MSTTRLCPGCKKKKPLNQFRIRGPSAGKRAGQVYGNCASCNKEREAERFNDDPGPYLISITQSRRRASTKNWDITTIDVINQWVKQQGVCALSGQDMTHTRGDGTVHTNASIDRIDNNKGYTKDNIQLVCQITNLMKNSLTEESLIEWCQAIINTHISKDDQKRR